MVAGFLRGSEGDFPKTIFTLRPQDRLLGKEPFRENMP
jgi:hypothetical protein